MHDLEKGRTGFLTKLKRRAVVKKVDNHWSCGIILLKF